MPDDAVSGSGVRPPQNDSDQPSRLVVAALADAHYRRLVASPDSARGRAQAGYGIASALATALLTAAVFSRFEDARLAVRILAVASVAAWAGAGAAFLWAVAVDVNPPLPPARRAKAGGFVDYVLETSKYERETIDRRQMSARLVSAVAAVLTIATVALIAAPTRITTNARLALTASGRATVARLCPGLRMETVEGHLDPAELRSSYVSLRIAAGLCNHRATTLRLPRAAVAGVVDTPLEK